MNIVILDGHAANPGDLPMDEIKALGEVTFYENTKAEDVIERAKDAEVILINKIQMTAEVMNALPRLRYIGVQATGYNVVDIDAASERGITVTNVPAYSTMSVAQQVFAHLLNVCNHVGHYADSVRRGEWARQTCFCYWDTPLMELDGKRLGIIGYGNIGRQVEKIAVAFGMDVVHASVQSGAAPTALEELLANSDIVTLHCPATPSTTGMVNADFLHRMRCGTILINTARGQLVNEHDVAMALKSGHLMAYCADTLAMEPPEVGNELASCPTAYITPHNAWGTREARMRLQHVVAQNLKSFLNGTPQNVVSVFGL